MSKKKTSMTAQELLAKLKSDPEYIKRQAAQEAEMAESSARCKEAEKLILLELKKVGLNVESVWDLVNSSEPYPEAIPILLKHLVLPYADAIREGIARALAVPDPEVRKAWATLVETYCNAPMGKGVKFPGDDRHFSLGFKDGLACALGAAVTDETMEEYINLFKDSRHGDYRILLIPALRKSKNPLAKKALEDMKDDPDLRIAIAEGAKPKNKFAS